MMTSVPTAATLVFVISAAMLVRGLGRRLLDVEAHARRLRGTEARMAGRG